MTIKPRNPIRVFFPFTRAVETQISQRAKDFGMDTDAQVLGKAGPGLYQRVLVRGSLIKFNEGLSSTGK